MPKDNEQIKLYQYLTKEKYLLNGGTRIPEVQGEPTDQDYALLLKFASSEINWLTGNQIGEDFSSIEDYINPFTGKIQKKEQRIAYVEEATLILASNFAERGLSWIRGSGSATIGSNFSISQTNPDDPDYFVQGVLRLLKNAHLYHMTLIKHYEPENNKIDLLYDPQTNIFTWPKLPLGPKNVELIAEQVVKSMLKAGRNIKFKYDQNVPSLTINATIKGKGGSFSVPIYNNPHAWKARVHPLVGDVGFIKNFDQQGTPVFIIETANNRDTTFLTGKTVYDRITHLFNEVEINRKDIRDNFNNGEANKREIEDNGLLIVANTKKIDANTAAIAKKGGNPAVVYNEDALKKRKLYVTDFNDHIVLNNNDKAAITFYNDGTMNITSVEGASIRTDKKLTLEGSDSLVITAQKGEPTLSLLKMDDNGFSLKADEMAFNGDSITFSSNDGVSIAQFLYNDQTNIGVLDMEGNKIINSKIEGNAMLTDLFAHTENIGKDTHDYETYWNNPQDWTFVSVFAINANEIYATNFGMYVSFMAHIQSMNIKQGMPIVNLRFGRQNGNYFVTGSIWNYANANLSNLKSNIMCGWIKVDNKIHFLIGINGGSQAKPNTISINFLKKTINESHGTIQKLYIKKKNITDTFHRIVTSWDKQTPKVTPGPTPTPAIGNQLTIGKINIDGSHESHPNIEIRVDNDNYVVVSAFMISGKHNGEPFSIEMNDLVTQGQIEAYEKQILDLIAFKQRTIPQMINFERGLATLKQKDDTFLQALTSVRNIVYKATDDIKKLTVKKQKVAVVKRYNYVRPYTGQQLLDKLNNFGFENITNMVAIIKYEHNLFTLPFVFKPRNEHELRDCYEIHYVDPSPEVNSILQVRMYDDGTYQESDRFYNVQNKNNVRGYVLEVIITGIANEEEE